VAQEWCDGFLELYRTGGAQLTGESTDAQYANAIELISFKFGSSSGFDDEDAFYRPQDQSKTTAPAEERFANNHDPLLDIGSLFGEQNSALGDAEFIWEEIEGTDLAGVSACQFEIVKQYDKSSPALFAAYCSSHDLETREVFETAHVNLRKSTGLKAIAAPNLTYLVMVFSDLIIYGYSLDVGDDGFPKETVKLAFGRCRMEYKPQLSSGRLGNVIKAGWSFLERDAW